MRGEYVGKINDKIVKAATRKGEGIEKLYGPRFSLKDHHGTKVVS